MAILLVLTGLLAALAACGAQRPGLLRRETPHEAYAEGLRRAGLAETALGRDWLAAADEALRSPSTAKLPLEMTTEYPASEPRAFGYRLALARGRVLRVDVTPAGSEPATVFIDLFRVTSDDPLEPPRPVTSADRGGLVLEHEIARDADYVLRIQPELLRSGTFRITQATSAALAFPVEGRTRAAVQSYFRDARDGGRREHHGIDIFAPRDTPVLAAAGGVVSVGTNNLGGNVVWLWDARRGISHYYAHLSRQAVSTGQVVEAGDVIGYVGNTGNARTTAPHLHFGLYARGDGPIDPLPFVE